MGYMLYLIAFVAVLSDSLTIKQYKNILKTRIRE